MSYVKDRIARKRAESEAYRAAYDEEAALLAQQQARRKDLVKHLAAVRRSRHLTQSKLAEAMKVSQSRVSQIERGEETFSVDSLLTMLDTLGVRLEIVPMEADASKTRERSSRAGTKVA